MVLSSCERVCEVRVGGSQHKIATEARLQTDKQSCSAESAAERETERERVFVCVCVCVCVVFSITAQARVYNVKCSC